MATFQTNHFKWEICSCCNGHGKVDHPAFRNAITSSEWQAMGEDWDSTGETNAQQRYMAGVYDVICDSCEGTGKVKCPQFKEMPRIERKAYIQFLRAEREERDFENMSRAEIAAERRIGA